ncbi:hypothetical protein [Paenibacillus alvei]|uniref:Uncharacterized protein n=1 Tax=Paenibacillus alvei TaxID=44250 RepID=A0A383RKX8_PAEAL|nr:hypothetical protein [Paenibacillus alvei]SYX85926.1 protein of unknown function [Paenibacillus alvei]SYX87677.1 protein of unknown function [Paenibacillus alvei]
MVRPRRNFVRMSYGTGYEYTTTAHGKLIPYNPESPVYSQQAKAEIQRLVQEELEYIESMSGPVKTYSINDIQGGNNQ